MRNKSVIAYFCVFALIALLFYKTQSIKEGAGTYVGQNGNKSGETGQDVIAFVIGCVVLWVLIYGIISVFYTN